MYDLPDQVVGIQLDANLDLESYWWKMCMFNLDWDEPTLYFDLDIVIQNNINYLFEKIDSKIKVCFYQDAGCKLLADCSYQNEIQTRPITDINSSVIGFIPSLHNEVYNSFISGSDHNMVYYYGLDRYLTNVYNNRLGHWDFSKDFYFRQKGSEYYDPKYVDFNNYMVHDPTKTFCIISQAHPEMYEGLEKYFL